MKPYLKLHLLERNLHKIAPVQILGKRGLFHKSTLKSGLKTVFLTTFLQ